MVGKQSLGTVDHVADQSGSRWVISCLIVAIFFGSLIRILIRPSAVTRLLNVYLESALGPGRLKFQTARVDLSDGIWPDLAVVVSRIEWSAGAICEGPAPVVAGEVRLPVRLSSHLIPRLGNLRLVDVRVDLDRAKDPCPGISDKPAPKTEVSNASVPREPASVAPRKAPTASGAEVVRRAPTSAGAEALGLWPEGLTERLEGILSGFDVERAELLFENRMKSVIFESGSLRLRGNSVSVETDLRIPPATVFGESLPILEIRGAATRAKAHLEARAQLSEGQMSAVGDFTPIADQRLASEIALQVKELPLSALSPLLLKAGFVSRSFHPKYLWLTCGIRVSGVFQRLLLDHPVDLSDCGIDGRAGRAGFSSARRLPSGAWEPFSGKVHSIDVHSMLEFLIGSGGVDGLSSMGRIDGEFRMAGDSERTFSGKWSGASVHPASMASSPAIPVSADRFILRLADRGRIQGSLSQMQWGGQAVDATVNVDIASDLKSGAAAVQLKDVPLPTVSGLLPLGLMAEAASGVLNWTVSDFRARLMGGDLALKSVTRNNGFRAAAAKWVWRDESSQNLAAQWLVSAKDVQVSAADPWLGSVAKLFLGAATGEDGSTHLREFQLSSVQNSKDESWSPPKGLILSEWDRLRATVRSGHYRPKESIPLELEVDVRAPRLRRSQWRVFGSAAGIQAEPFSEEAKQWSGKASVAAKDLGL